MKSSINNLVKLADVFYKDLNADPNDRYRSWEHCYEAFTSARADKVGTNDIELLCLHLSFYLASWGMYRGSSFLLKKDYLVHKEAVKIILEKKYDALLSIECKDYDTSRIDLLFDLVGRLKRTYQSIKGPVKKGASMNVSDTLISKILLGTLGCTPAYDRFFIAGVKEEQVAASVLNRLSIKQLCEHYVQYEKEYEAFRHTTHLKVAGRYPQMKILDMVFWERGTQLAK
ncbi:MAG: hypothetical protein MJY44_02770 [Bacteroidales bacterium]|nr:hypothetical protein [Bacteroidales bacterium]